MSTQRTPLVLAETASSLIAVSTPLHGSPTGSGSLPATWGRRRSVTATCAPTALLTISEPVAATMQLPFSAASPAAGPKAFSALHLERGDGPGTFAALAGRLGLCNTAESPLHLSTDSSIAAALTGAAAAILRGYRSLPYHNWRHALDTAHFLCRAIERTSEAGTAARLSPIDRLAALVAALGHDVDHRGHTNSFEASSLSELALTYNSDSVLEHHHAAVLFRTLHSKQHPALAQRMAAAASPPSSTAASAVGGAGSHSLIPHVPAHSNILGLDLADFKRLRQVAVDAILGTDMARHAELVDATRTRGATLAPNELITVLLHAADISAPLHPDFSVAYEWSERCNAEFAAQAAAEAAMGLPSAPFMHALGTRRSRASQQLVFLDFVVTPFWRTLSDAFPEIGEECLIFSVAAARPCLVTPQSHLQLILLRHSLHIAASTRTSLEAMLLQR